MFPEETFCRKTHVDLLAGAQNAPPGAAREGSSSAAGGIVTNVRHAKAKAKAQRSVYPAVPIGEGGWSESRNDE
jgi:hypothetical protein